MPPAGRSAAPVLVEAALYVVASVVLSILGVFAGFHLFRAVLS